MVVSEGAKRISQLYKLDKLFVFQAEVLHSEVYGI